MINIPQDTPQSLTSDNRGYVALGLAHRNEIRTWWFVEKGAVAKNLGFVDTLLKKTHCNSYFRHKQAKKNGDFPRHKVLRGKGRLTYTFETRTPHFVWCQVDNNFVHNFDQNRK